MSVARSSFALGYIKGSFRNIFTVSSLLKKSFFKSSSANALKVAVYNRSANTNALLNSSLFRSHVADGLLKASYVSFNLTRAFLVGTGSGFQSVNLLKLSAAIVDQKINALIRLSSLQSQSVAAVLVKYNFRFHLSNSLLNGFSLRTHFANGLLMLESASFQVLDALLTVSSRDQSVDSRFYFSYVSMSTDIVKLAADVLISSSVNTLVALSNSLSQKVTSFLYKKTESTSTSVFKKFGCVISGVFDIPQTNIKTLRAFNTNRVLLELDGWGKSDIVDRRTGVESVFLPVVSSLPSRDIKSDPIKPLKLIAPGIKPDDVKSLTSFPTINRRNFDVHQPTKNSNSDYFELITSSQAVIPEPVVFQEELHVNSGTKPTEAISTITLPKSKSGFDIGHPSKRNDINATQFVSAPVNHAQPEIVRQLNTIDNFITPGTRPMRDTKPITLPTTHKNFDVKPIRNAPKPNQFQRAVIRVNNENMITQPPVNTNFNNPVAPSFVAVDGDEKFVLPSVTRTCFSSFMPSRGK